MYTIRFLSRQLCNISFFPQFGLFENKLILLTVALNFKLFCHYFFFSFHLFIRIINFPNKNLRITYEQKEKKR